MEKQVFEGYTGVWRRMKSGAAVFIRDGEDIKTAVRRNFNSKKMENKRSELINKESDLIHKTMDYRNKISKLSKEKGELSEELADARKLYSVYDRESRNATLDRSTHEHKMAEVELQNKKGIKIKSAEADTLKQVGNVKQNTDDFENSVIKHKNTRAELNKTGMQNASPEMVNKDLSDEMSMNEFRNKYSRFYGHEAMKDVEARAISSLDKDIEIEGDIKSLFIYKNEKGMGSLDSEPLKRYYDKHGKENVDRVWKQMEDKYDVIEGTSMDSEGLRYNNLIEKSKYNPEAIQAYKNKMNTIYEKYGYDSREYNAAAKAAADEFETTGLTRKQRAKAIDKANGADKDYETTKKDLLNHYTEDYGYDGNPEDAFVKQMDAVNYGHDNPYEMGKRLAEGGNYLIYNGDMVEYLAARGIKSNIDNAFDKYTDYIGKQSARLYEEIKKRKK